MDSVLMNREYDHTHGLLGIEMQTVLITCRIPNHSADSSGSGTEIVYGSGTY